MFEQTGAHIWEERWAGHLDFYRKLFSWYVDDSKARLYVVIFSGSSQRSSPTTSFPCNYCKFGEVTVTMVTLFLVWFWVVLGAYRHPFFSIFQCRKYLLPFMSVPFLFPIPKTDFPCWEKQLNDGWGTEKNDNEEQNVSSLDFDGLKKDLNQRWNCICCGKGIAIWNIFGALCPRYITGLTMETYLNWAAAEKVRQKPTKRLFLGVT